MIGDVDRDVAARWAGGGGDGVSALPGARVARKRDASGAAVGAQQAVGEPQKHAGGSLVFPLVLVALIAALAAGAIAFLQLYR